LVFKCLNKEVDVYNINVSFRKALKVRKIFTPKFRILFDTNNGLKFCYVLFIYIYIYIYIYTHTHTHIDIDKICFEQ